MMFQKRNYHMKKYVVWLVFVWELYLKYVVDFKQACASLVDIMSSNSI